jgi:lipoate---protein ligase
MLYIHKNSYDPWFNIAADEFILRHLKEDICMLWRNTPCVVVGKHQQTLSEINRHYLTEKSIPVIRRISGGGTVYHDFNCLNYSFITTSKSESDRINFELFTRPVREFLQSVGVDARLTGKSNITVRGKKISGNAAHVFKNRSIHHGTLLFDTDLEVLSQSIQVPEHNYQTKAVQSIRAQVVNIAQLLDRSVLIDDFTEKLRQFLIQWFPVSEERVLTHEEISAIEKLADEKYKSWAWTYGYSPDYQFERVLTIGGEQAEIRLTVKKGVIIQVEAMNNAAPNLLTLLAGRLNGVNHNFEDMYQVFKTSDLIPEPNDEIYKVFVNQLI